MAIMKAKIIALIVTLAVAAGLYWAWRHYEAFLTQGMKAPETMQRLNELEQTGLPEFTVKNIRGQDISPSQFAGKVLVVNFWASWCNPCVQEFPSMLKLVEHFKGEVVLLAISADSSFNDMKSFVDLMKADRPHVEILWDIEKRASKLFGTETLPESYIVTREGKVVRKVVGLEDWSSAMAIRFFEDLVGK